MLNALLGIKINMPLDSNLQATIIRSSIAKKHQIKNVKQNKITYVFRKNDRFHLTVKL